jgi:VWFA-related protein
VLVDNANLHPRNRRIVFRALREFLATGTGPGDRILVAAFHHDYDVVQPFTDSSADVVRAIDSLEKAPADGHVTLNERRLIVRDLGRANLTPFGTASGEIGTAQTRMRVESEARQTLQRIENVAFETRQRTLNTIGVLRYLLGSMAGLPEPKAILYLSDGLELRPAETLFTAHYNRFADIAQILEFNVALTPPQALTEEYDLSREFTALASDAQAANVAFFCLDASGQTDMMGGSAELAQRDVGNGAVPAVPVWTQRNDILTEQNLQSSLQLLAAETGGEVLLNTRNYHSFFDDLRSSLDNYYSLGFQAPHDREGRRHRLEVRVDRPGLEVSYQQAYLDKPWETRLTEQTVATLVLGTPIGDMPLRAIPGKSTPQGKKFVMPLQILVPVDALGLLPDGVGHVAHLTLTVVTKDAKGNTRPAQITELRLRLTEEQRTTIENGEASIRLLIDPEPQEIGIGVRDRTTGRSATTMVAVDPRV